MTDSSLGNNAAADIISIIERVERMEEFILERREDIKEVFSEARSKGFDTKTLKRLIALRKKKTDTRKEEAAILGIYADAIQLELFDGA